jgi:4'-phosphopantetheinyl transferase EntD
MNLAPRLARLFPAGAVAVELTGSGDPATLVAAEMAACSGYSTKRLMEFAAGRMCARRALRELGYDGVTLLANADRTPRWPAGSVGSITHTDGYCAAVVGDAARFRGVGVDAELVGRVTVDTWRLLFTSVDLEQLAAAGGAGERARLATIIFSAKEAFYKCQYALTGAWVDFHDVAVRVEPAGPDSGTFTVQETHPIPVLDELVPLTGRYEIDGDIVVTGAGITVASKPRRAYPPIHGCAR